VGFNNYIEIFYGFDIEEGWGCWTGDTPRWWEDGEEGGDLEDSYLTVYEENRGPDDPESSGCGIGDYCSYASGMHYVYAVREGFDGTELNDIDFEAIKALVTDDVEYRLRAFCRVLGIEYKEPKWQITALYPR
jgi:hypothetical protein